MSGWHADAACYQCDEDMLSPQRRGGTEASKYIAKYCMACPVVPECIEAAVEVPASKLVGIWGGIYIPFGRGRNRGLRELEEEAARLSVLPHDRELSRVH